MTSSGRADGPTDFDVVIPSAGRPSLSALISALGSGGGPLPRRVLVVDDRPDPGDVPVVESVPEALDGRLEIVRGPARGPAAARNAGWRAASATWVAFLDDDVVTEPDWRQRLASDLARLGPGFAATQGRITVPLPSGRRPTDWERNVSGLERALWATADMAYRRAVLVAVDGFDERFPRAYREDADLGLRVTRAGWTIARGTRGVVHPVAPAPASISLAKQAGNADDVLMRALHGRGWRETCAAPPGRRPRHLATTAAALVAGGAAVSRRRRVALLAGAAWAGGTAELAWARIGPGPRTPAEVASMLWTSALMPPLAAGWWLRGLATLRRRVADVEHAPHGALAHGVGGAAPDAVLFDRDGTLVVDVPYNGDPSLVRPVPTARVALDKLRRAGIPTAVVSNQSGIARGLLDDGQVRSVNARIEELLGPLGPWEYCPHGPEDGCACRKPQPGLVVEAARRLGVDPRRVAVVGDIGADVDAARAAGARAVMVPTERTRAEEVAAAPHVAADLESAVDMLLAGRA